MVHKIERTQTGVRMEKRILRVLKAVAELHDLTLGDLLEGIVLHAFEGKSAFGKPSLARIAELKKVYQLDLVASASPRLREAPGRAGGTTNRRQARARTTLASCRLTSCSRISTRTPSTRPRSTTGTTSPPPGRPCASRAPPSASAAGCAASPNAPTSPSATTSN